MAELKFEINQYLDQLPAEKLEMVHAFVSFLVAQSSITPETPSNLGQTENDNLLDHVMGRYAHLPNSGDRFASQKHLEIELEEHSL
jgi:hypothetical protein